MVTAPKTVRVRKSVLSLGHKGDDLDWYAQAVASLLLRPLNDPTSWRYMAAVHGYPGHAADPFAQSKEKLPSSADQKAYWNQCQHQSWFFLPWHRGYLACFEEIVAAAVVAAGGPPGWALPYWNYSAASAHSSELPAAFRDRFDSHGKPNPLWVAGRDMPSPTAALPASHVDLDALKHSPFKGSSGGGDPGFGGVQTGFSHFGGTNGRLESLPHNQVHVDVGGLMTDPDTAALDPIFWLHHANIDRLWEVWTQRDPSHVNPALKSWLSGTSFQLHDANGKIVKFSSGQMEDTLKVRHGYRYDDISDPFKAPAAVAATAAAGAAGAGVTAGAPQAPQLVGAAPGAVPLGDAATQAQVAFDQPARLAAVAGVASRPVRAYLNLENVRGPGAPRNYEVYVDAPKPPTASAAEASRKPLLAGHLSTFGVRKASGPSAAHGGAGITTVIEISSLIEQLHRERNWDGARLEVSFVPSGPAPAQPAGSGQIEVGRVSVYYA